MNNCPNCGGTLIGDGVTMVLHCENVDLDALDCRPEPDADPVYCEDEAMQHNETGREPTDAELLRFWAEMDRLRMECAANHSKVDEYDLACIADNNAHKAVICRAREYLSGQRPMPKSWPITLADVLGHELPDTPAPDEQDATLVKLIDLLTRTANAVKGQPGEMKQHGWADLPELCTALTARVAELEAELAALREGNEIIVGHSETRGGWCVYEQTGPGEYEMLKGPFPTHEEAEAAMRSQAAPGKELPDA